MSFFQRRIVAPIAAQLTQGVTPEKIALTLALGGALSVFPILGSTTVLCGLAAVAFRLNQPIIQLLNWFCYPLQIALLIPFYRAGEQVLRREPVPLSISLLLERFKADFVQFLKDFGMVAVGGIVVWAILAPLAIAIVYYGTRPALRGLAGKLKPQS